MIYRGWVYIILIVFGISCGTVNVETVKPTNNDLSRYNTFAYLPNSSVSNRGVDYNNEKVNRAIVEIININMQQAGYTVNKQNPDLLVLISTKTNKEIAVDADPVYASYPYTPMASTIRPFYEPFYYSGFTRLTRIVGYDTDTYQYKEGTLVINLVDRQTQETVWKGIATDNIYNQGTTAAIQQLVNEIFEKYPITD